MSDERFITEAEIEACAARGVATVTEAREAFTAAEYGRGTDFALMAMCWRAAVVAELQALRHFDRAMEASGGDPEVTLAMLGMSGTDAEVRRARGFLTGAPIEGRT